jgi:hypothetical protein
MKHTLNPINGLVACALAVAMVSSVAAQSALDGAAKVVRKKGSARYTTGNNVWQPLEVGAVLKPGTIVQTSNERGSYVDLVLGDGTAPVPQPAVYRPSIPSSAAMAAAASASYQPSAQQNIVRIWENSALGIDKLTSLQTGADVVTDTQLDLKAGRVTGSVKKMSAASKYEIKLPNGVAGIRGTLFDISAEGVIKVVVGSVVSAMVDSKSGNVVTQVVMGGQQYDARSGQITPLSPTDQKALSGVFGGGGAAAPPVLTPVLLNSDMTLTLVSPAAPPAPPAGGGGN